jgi:hypothetical protein
MAATHPAAGASGAEGPARSYACLLDAVGCFLEQAELVDVCVAELSGGLLLTCLATTAQEVLTLDGADLQRLVAEAGRTDSQRQGRRGPLGMLFGRPPRREVQGVRTALGAVGQYLDRHHAHCVLVQRRERGMP